MKKNQVLIILLLIVLFLYLKPSPYVAAPPAGPPAGPPAPIKYNLIQGPPLPELADVPKSNQLLTNYKNTMDNYLAALSKSYVTTALGVAYVKNPATGIINYNSVVRKFIAQHNAYFKPKPTTDVCSWIGSVTNLAQEASYVNVLLSQYPDPGLYRLIPFLSTNLLINVGNNIYSKLGSSC
jgi:hypothetical protein